MAKAIVRREVEKIEGVSRTWIEYDFNGDDVRSPVLVVEVDFDTDANSSDWNETALYEIGRIAKDTLKNKTTMVISKLRVVPKHR